MIHTAAHTNRLCHWKTALTLTLLLTLTTAMTS
jgi:hypothetical protein